MSVYVPPHFASGDREAVARLLRDHPFATLVTPASDEPQVSHLPLVHCADREPHGTLLGHFARANPHWEHAAGTESIAIFHGPHAYVSPTWYADPTAAVPTWNYAVVHAHGSLELAADAAATRAILDTMVERFESRRDAPWRLALDARRREAMIGAIVGFRFAIRRLDVKLKLSQNRSADDRRRVAAALAAQGDPDSGATAEWMRAFGGNADDDAR